jgi:hypothetical protein
MSQYNTFTELKMKQIVKDTNCWLRCCGLDAVIIFKFLICWLVYTLIDS